MNKSAVLLIQLGTPDAPTTPALRRYLRQFLGDPRVIEVPRLKWWFILNLFILPFRPKQSAAKYQRIWHPQTGSPLLHWTKKDVWGFIVNHDVPYNPLHDRDYPSIGCWPCTRAVGVGEDDRAGRWSGSQKTECGIHLAVTPGG